jgi:hypothetical protein
MIILGWNYTFGMKQKVRLHAKIGWIRKKIYVYYKHKHFDHTSMGHILLHVVTSNVFFIINYECIALFLKFSLNVLYFWLKRYLKPKKKNTLKKMKSKIVSIAANKIQ